MRKHNYPGKFVVFEGLDGSGNTTQADRLNKNLRDAGKKSYLTKEPTDSLIGGMIRSRLRGEWETSPEALQLLFTADRAHHLFRKIEPLLKDGAFVVCDRYFFSTLAYGATDIDMEWLLELNDKFILPDLTFLIEVDPKICVERMSNDRQGFELFEEEKRLSDVWSKYEKLAGKYKNVVNIDGEKSVDVNSEKIFKIVKTDLF